MARGATGTRNAYRGAPHVKLQSALMTAASEDVAPERLPTSSGSIGIPTLGVGTS